MLELENYLKANKIDNLSIENIKDFPITNIMFQSMTNFLFNVKYKMVHENDRMEISEKDFQTNIIKYFHDSPIGGHFGIKKTIYNIKSQYYW